MTQPTPTADAACTDIRAAVMSGDELYRFRGYLRSLAAGLAPQHGHRMDPSDVAQQTLLEAYRIRRQFRGHSRAQVAQWLKQILSRNVIDAGRALRRQKRDIKRETPMQTNDAESSCLAAQEWLASDQTSPSQGVERSEQALRLADAIRQLPQLQREAVVLRHLNGHSLSEVAEMLDCSKPAVAGLLHRGLKSLRVTMSDVAPPK